MTVAELENAWREDLETHIDFEEWQFISRDGLKYEDADKTKPFVCFGSFFVCFLGLCRSCNAY